MIDPEKQPQSEKIEKNAVKASVKKSDEATMAFFLHAVLFSFFGSTLAFLLFLKAHGYPVILNNNIQPEFLFVVGIVFAVVFLLTLVVSFSRFLLTLWLSVVAGGCVAYLLGVLLPYNAGEYVVSFSPVSLGKQVTFFLALHGNLLFGVLSGLLFFILLRLFGSSPLGLSTVGMLCCLIYTLNAVAGMRIPSVETKKNTVSDFAEQNKNVIVLLLADHVGYDFALNKWRDVAGAAETYVPFFVNDFYKENGFVFYPKAYARHVDRPRALAAAVNPRLTEVTKDLFGYDDYSYFSVADDAPVTLLKNDLFSQMRSLGYAINVYQTTPVNFCGEKNETVDKCVTYPAPTGFLYDSSLTTSSKVMLLLSQWIHSASLGRDALNFLRDKLIDKRLIGKTTPFFGNPMDRSLPVGQSEVLARLRADVSRATGKNMFFAHLMLPHYPYMYDKYCRLTPMPEKWGRPKPVSERLDPAGERDAWKAYDDQLACVYGQLEYMIDELKKTDALKDTTIIIAGDKGADIAEDAKVRKNMSFFDEKLNTFKKNLSTVFAVRLPQNPNYQMVPTACDTGSLIMRYLTNDTQIACQLFDQRSLTDGQISDLGMFFAQPTSDSRYAKASEWKAAYDDFLEKGGAVYIKKTDDLVKEKQKAEADRKGKVDFIAPPTVDPKAPLADRVVTQDLNVPVPSVGDEGVPEEAAEKEAVVPNEQIEEKVSEPETVVEPQKQPEIVAPAPEPVKVEAKKEIVTPVPEPVKAEAKKEKAAPAPEPVKAEAKKEKAAPAPEPVKAEAKKETVVPAPEPVKAEVKKEKVAPAPEPVKVEAKKEKAAPAPEPVKAEAKKEKAAPAPEPVKAEAKKEKVAPAPEPVKVEAKKEKAVPAPEPVKAEAKKEKAESKSPAVQSIKQEKKAKGSAVQKEVKASEKPAASKEKTPAKAASVKKTAPVKKKEAKKPKTQQKTTADSPLPPTSAPEKWRLQGRQNVVATGQAVDSLDELDFVLMEVPVPADKGKKASEPATAVKESAPVVEKRSEVPVQKPTTQENGNDKQPPREQAAQVDETPVTVSLRAIKPTVVKTVRTTPKEVVVEEKVVVSSAATAVEAEIATGKKRRVSEIATPVLKETPVQAEAVKKSPVEKKAKTQPETSKAVKEPAVEKPAVEPSVLKKEPVAGQTMSSSELKKQETTEKALKTTNVDREKSDKPVKILRDSVTTRVNPYGEEEVFIVIERTDEPGRVLTPKQLDELINKAR